MNDDKNQIKIQILLECLHNEFLLLYNNEMIKCSEFFLYHSKSVKAKFIKLSWDMIKLNQDKI